MALLMVLTMILPASLATYAVDPDSAEFPEVQQSQQPQELQQPVDLQDDVQNPEAPEALQDVQQSQEPEGSQQLQEPQEPATFEPLEEGATLVPLDDPGPDPAEPYEPPAGEGAEASPYLIASLADLQWMRMQIGTQATAAEYRVAHYKLVADIDMADVENWAPIGPDTALSFAGVFDGDGHTISNVSIAATISNLGFFGSLNGATVKDLALVNLNVVQATGTTGAGGIAGSVAGASSTISGCSVSGTIRSSGSAVGGILGMAYTGITIDNCRVDGVVTAAYSGGGILGSYSGTAANGNALIRNSLVTATVEGTATTGNIGGILGIKDNATGAVTIENCRVLSQSVSVQNSTRTGAIYGVATGNGALTTTDVSAWKGLELGGIPLKEILYGDPLFSNDRNGATILSWKLASQDGWPAGLASNTGTWSYTAGKIPVLTRFSGKMSDEFPEYMADYLTPPSGTVSKAALTAAIQVAEALQFSQYPDAWDDFQVSLIRAKIVLNDDEPTQTELDAAVEVLEDAVELLKARNALELTGEGTEAEPYLIADAAQLQKMDRLVNSADALVRNAYRDKYYKLTENIDMTSLSWLPLGDTAAAAFTGTFDGNSKTISNLTVNGTSYVGMFGYISGATIRDLSLEDCDIRSTGGYAAGLAANSTAGSTITGCQVSGTVSGTSPLGGIVAYATDSITVRDCSVEGAIAGVVVTSGGQGQLAGIIGRAQGGTRATVTVEDCSVSADITTEGSYAAGIVGYVMASSINTMTIKDCAVNLGADDSITATYEVAGIVCNAPSSLTVENCSVIGGTLRATATTATARIGGIVGDVPNSTKVQLTDCYVRTDIEAANSYAGGLVGWIQNNATSVSVTGCAFSGSITGSGGIGGLVGTGTRLTVANCSVDGALAGTGQNVGGIIGSKSSVGDVSIKDSYTLANLSGRAAVGGILGQQASNDAGRLSVEGCRVLGESVLRGSLSTETTLGALSGDARYHTAYYTQTDTFAWGGMILDRKTLETTIGSDPFFSPERNGQGFLGWALKSEAGWPTNLTSNTGAWSYSAGELPVLKKFQEIMSSDFPEYMADLPDSGTLGDKADLVAAIAAAEALNSADYVEEGAMWAEVQRKLLPARQIADLYDASQAVIDAAKTALEGAMAELDRLNNITFTGEGTAAAPYEVSDLDLLLKMGRVVNSSDITIRNKYRAVSYRLTADIDLDGVPWSPLGGIANATAFTGIFDGGGKTISNLRLSGTTYLGFFGYVSGATITNLMIEDFSIGGTDTIGAVAAYSSAATITDCAVSGTITANGSAIGGITSYLNGTISGCTAEIDILDSSRSGNYVGGIVGNFALGTIEDCSVCNYSVGGAIVNNNSGSSNGYAGGIAGGISSGANVATIRSCQVTANIVGLNAGGMVGYGTSSGTNAEPRIVISGCYFDGMLAPATTTTAANLGGIAGTMLNNFTITDCRSDGTITMAAVAGGILGRYSGTTASDVTIANCYTTMRIGNGTTAGGIVGNNGVTNNNGKLVITDSFALNEQVGGEGAAEEIHAFGEDNTKFDYTLAGVKAWDGMLIRVAGETQAAPSGDGAVSYSDLQTAAGWPLAFQSGPWTYAVGKLPVLTSLSGNMSSDFPAWMTNPGARQDIANTRELLALVSNTDALVEATWTAESWAALTEALDAARVLLRNALAMQSAIDAATEALEAAIDDLELYKEVTTLEGEGTEESPFLIGSAEDYDEMSRLLDISDFYRAAYYRLTSDIDLYDPQGGFHSPLPYTTTTSLSEAVVFAGDFDGGGFTISNLTVRHTWATGMFGWVSGAKIHDLNLENCDVSGSGTYTGAIAGNARDTVFENINVTGTVAGLSSLGGIVGAGSSTLKNCHFEGTVETKSGVAYHVGGLCGGFSGSIEDCSFKGKLLYKGVSQLEVLMGGIVGLFSGKDIKGCYVEADIIYEHHTGDSYGNPGGNLAGIVGRFDGENIIDCHFKGRIDDRGENIAGIVGIFNGLSIRDCTSEGELTMNYPNASTESYPRPAGGIVGRVDTGSGRDVVIDNVTSSMGIGGFREAGGIGGVVTGGGSLTISNSKAMNTYLNNSASDLYVDPFFFGEDTYWAFTGTYTSENNYIWDGMTINGKTLAEWLEQTLNGGKYGGGAGGITIITGPQNPNPDPGPSDPGDPNPNPNPGSGPTGSFAPTGIGTSGTDADATGIATAGQTGSGQTLLSSGTREPVVTPPPPETPLSDPTTATEVSLTPIPLGLGFQTVANTILTLAVGFVTLGIFILGGFIFWRMYRRRIDAQ
jgi:hypothetical protein